MVECISFSRGDADILYKGKTSGDQVEMDWMSFRNKHKTSGGQVENKWRWTGCHFATSIKQVEVKWRTSGHGMDVISQA